MKRRTCQGSRRNPTFFREILPHIFSPHTSEIFRQKEFKLGSVWIQNHTLAAGRAREKRAPGHHRHPGALSAWGKEEKEADPHHTVPFLLKTAKVGSISPNVFKNMFQRTTERAQKILQVANLGPRSWDDKSDPTSHLSQHLIQTPLMSLFHSSHLYWNRL